MPSVNDSIPPVLPDSTSNILDCFEDFITTSNPLVYSFWLSVGAILSIYLLKKLYIKEVYTGEEILPAIQEFFIDLCVTMIPLIAIGCMEVNRPNFGFFLVSIATIIVSFCAYLRRLSSEYYKGKKYIKMSVCIAFCIFFCLVVICSVYHYISERWIH